MYNCFQPHHQVPMASHHQKSPLLNSTFLKSLFPLETTKVYRVQELTELTLLFLPKHYFNVAFLNKPVTPFIDSHLNLHIKQKTLSPSNVSPRFPTEKISPIYPFNEGGVRRVHIWTCKSLSEEKKGYKLETLLNCVSLSTDIESTHISSPLCLG